MMFLRSLLRSFTVFFLSLMAFTVNAEMQKFVYAYDNNASLVTPANAASQCPQPDNGPLTTGVCKGVRVNDDGSYSFRIDKNQVPPGKLIMISNEYEFLAAGSHAQITEDTYILIESRRRVEKIQGNQTNSGVNINTLSETLVQAVERSQQTGNSSKGKVGSELAATLDDIEPEKLNSAMGNGKRDNTPANNSKKERDLIDAQQEKLSDNDQQALLDVATLVVDNQDDENITTEIRKNILQAVTSPELLNEVSDRVYAHINRLQNQSNQTPTIILESDRYLIHASESATLTTANSINPDQFFAYTWQGVDSERSTAVYNASEAGNYLICVSGEMQSGNDSSSDCIRLLVQQDAYALARANRKRVPIDGKVIVSGEFSVGANSFAWSGQGEFINDSVEKTIWTAPTVPGNYTLTLTVNGNLTDTVDIEVFDVIPVAIAESNRDTIVLGNDPEDDSAILTSVSVTTDGSAIDTHLWEVIDSPQNGTHTLVSASASSTTFTADTSGLHTIRLTVTRGDHTDSTELDLLVTEAGAPVAIAGEDRISYRNEPILLDGNKSYDADNLPLSYQWTAAGGLIEDVRSGIARFTASSMGEYQADLVISNGSKSSTDSLNISVRNRIPVSSDDVIASDIQQIVYDQLRSIDGDQDSMQYSLVTPAFYGGVTIDPNTGAFVYIPGDNKGCRYKPYAPPHANDNGGLDVPVIKLCADKYLIRPGDIVNLTTSNSINASKFSGYIWTNNAVADPTDIRRATWTATEAGTYKVCVIGNVGQSRNTSTACVELTVDPNAPAWTDGPVTEGYTDRFQFRTHDGYDHSNIATVILTIGWTNTRPVVADIQFSMQEDSSYSDGQLEGQDADNHALRYTISRQASKGNATITDSTRGRFTYVPNVNASGTDTFRYRVNDGYLFSEEGTVTVTINPVNDLPVSYFSGTLSTYMNTPVNGNLGSRDPDADTLSYILTSQPALGTVVIDATTGAVTYTPNVGVTGNDSFTFLVNDGTVNSNITTVPVTIVNRAPLAQNSLHIIEEEQPLSASLSATDQDNHPLTYRFTSQPTMGTISMLDASSGSFRYTPDKDAVGTDTINFLANDGKDDSNTAELRITISQVNDAPLAQDGAFETYADETLAGRAVGTDIDTDTLSYHVMLNGSKGSLSFDSDNTGRFTYIPDGSQTGNDTVTYVVRDQLAVSNTASLTINIKPANIAPVAQDKNISVYETVTYRSQLLATDTDSNTLEYRIVNKPQHGVVVLEDSQTGTFRYIADNNAGSSDTFSFEADDGNKVSNIATVNINIQDIDGLCAGPMNLMQDTDKDGYADFIERAYGIPHDDALLNPQSLIDQGSVQSFIDDDDSDAYADFAEVWLGTVPSDAQSRPTFSDINAVPGCLSLNNDALPPSLLAFTALTPTLDLSNGALPARFALSVVDNATGVREVSVRLRSPSGVEVNGKLTISNNPRVFAGILSTELFSPYAEAGSWNIEELKLTDTMKNTTVLDNATLRALQFPASIEVINPNSDLIAPTLESLAMANDDFVATANTIVSVNIGAADNLSGVKQIKLALRSPSGEYHWGSLKFDNGQTSVNTKIDITSIGAFAEIGTWSIAEIEILDAAGNRLHLTADQLTGYGFNIYFNCTGNSVDTSKPELLGFDISTPVIDLWSSNLTGICVYNVRDTGSGIRSVIFETLTPSGNIMRSSLNNLGYSLNWLSEFRSQFTRNSEVGIYRVNRILIDDIAGNRAIYTTSQLIQAGYPTEILVRALGGGGINQRPVAYDAQLTVLEDNTLNSSMNAVDADGDRLNYFITSATSNGTVNISNAATGSFSYVPNADFFGTDQFSFRVDDGYSESHTATVTITVDSVNDKPLAEDLIITTFEDTPFDGVFKGSDVDSSALTYQIVSNGSLGTAVVTDSSGTFRYTPNNAATGTDSFTYVVTDGQLASEPATVNVNITGVISLKSFKVLSPVVNSYLDGSTSAISWEIALSQDISNFREIRIELIGPNGEIRSFLSSNLSGISGPLLVTRSYDAGTSVMPLGTWQFRNIRIVKNNELNNAYYVNDIGAEGFTDTLEVVRGGSANAPVAQGDSITVFEGVPYSGQLVATDNDSNSLSYHRITDGSLGSADIELNSGLYTYTPAIGNTGTDQFAYTARDDSHVSDTANININIISTDTLCSGSQLVNNADRDGDGYADILEQAFNTDINDASDTPAGLQASDSGITFRDDDDSDNFTDISEIWLGSLYNDASSLPTRSLNRALPACFDASSDGIKPWLLGFKVLTPAVTINDGTEGARFAMSMIDNASGIKRVRLNLLSPNNMFITTSVSLDDYPLVHGMEMQTAAFGNFAEPGTWHVSSITIYDEAGNRRSLDRQALEDAGFTTAFSVNNQNGDTQAPELDSFNITTPEVYPGTGNATMRFNIGLSDAGSGISSARIDMISPSGTVVSAAATLAQPDNSLVMAMETPVLSQYTEEGVWMVYNLIVVDAAGNSIQLVDRLWDLGYEITLNVTNPASDNIAPQVTGFSVLTDSVNPLTGDAVMSFALSATDNLSGVKKVRIDIIGPSGQYIEANGNLADDGILVTTVQLDTDTLSTQLETGTWQVVTVEVFDAAGNSTLLDNTDLGNAGFGSSITISH